MRADRGETARLRLAPAALVGMLVAVALAGPALDPSSVVTAALLALVVAILRFGGYHGAAPASAATPPSTARRAASYLSCRVTDTPRSPRRPRAPGLG